MGHGCQFSICSFLGFMSTSLISARRLNASASISFEIPISISASNFSQKRKKASGRTAFGSKPNALCLTYSLVDNPHFEALRSIFFFSFSVTLATILMSLMCFHLSFFIGDIKGTPLTGGIWHTNALLATV